MIFKNILLTTDLSPLSRAGLKKVESILPKGGNVTLLTVVSDWLIPMVRGKPANSPALRQFQQSALDEAKGELERLAKEIFGKRKIALEAIAASSAPEGICDYAREAKTNLIIMGAHGQGKLTVFLGTTAQKVLKFAPCPVLVIPDAVAGKK